MPAEDSLGTRSLSQIAAFPGTVNGKCREHEVYVRLLACNWRLRSKMILNPVSRIVCQPVACQDCRCKDRRILFKSSPWVSERGLAFHASTPEGGGGGSGLVHDGKPTPDRNNDVLLHSPIPIARNPN